MKEIFIKFYKELKEISNIKDEELTPIIEGAKILLEQLKDDNISNDINKNLLELNRLNDIYNGYYLDLNRLAAEECLNVYNFGTDYIGNCIHNELNMVLYNI